jgi:hypothetical protein
VWYYRACTGYEVVCLKLAVWRSEQSSSLQTGGCEMSRAAIVVRMSGTTLGLNTSSCGVWSGTTHREVGMPLLLFARDLCARVCMHVHTRALSNHAVKFRQTQGQDMTWRDMTGIGRWAESGLYGIVRCLAYLKACIQYLEITLWGRSSFK